MILSPGGTIGILGAGQLGRMLAIAALKIGLRTHIFAPDAEAPAYDAAAGRTTAGYDDEEALAAFAKSVDVVTYEFENVPVQTAEFLERRVPLRPGVRALAVTQDRLTEKSFLRDLGLKTAPFVGVEDAGARVRARMWCSCSFSLRSKATISPSRLRAAITETSRSNAMNPSRIIGAPPIARWTAATFEPSRISDWPFPS